MIPISLGTYLENFFSDKKERLSELYPGLTINRLKDELTQYARQKKINVDDLFSSRYIPSHTNPITNYFNSLVKGYPLEYIRGRAHFYKSEFDVSENVLIPRSETEILVETASSFLRDWMKMSDERLRILDIGTGSGAIIISLLQEMPRPLEAFATDISKDALEVARRNYFNLRYTIPRESSLRLICTDRMNDLDQEKFHLIVSNPPYIKKREDRDFVHHQVDNYEPHLALYLEDDSYDEWFRTLFKQVLNSLYEEGIFIMEGHEDHLEDLCEVCNMIGFSTVKILKDYTNRNRFLVAKK
ncbi:putative methyltransferase [Halobacteriovorax marinus SJ]|uniref:peptide chain release factor N(5)-glutamine methyltransferase n=1 Tax=Halobacteriovorax marinus (strain ATCC BAA-682 / DSM 15412 / SJ) TaxID=862908 RepID=E1X563_HALMS|nr:HemK/PrmC family methyltransferase [Halobacteriovorax marinus]CBW25535.1 putative methyltransferase [Halobacteriovorax marinus SJ]